jgi:hypothetical protein
MAKKFPIKPAHPERICWGCDKYCPADAMLCGNGTIATPHPSELFGDDWMDWGLDAAKTPDTVRSDEALQPGPDPRAVIESADATRLPR